MFFNTVVFWSCRSSDFAPLCDKKLCLIPSYLKKRHSIDRNPQQEGCASGEQELQSNMFIALVHLDFISLEFFRLADYWETQAGSTEWMSPWNLFHCRRRKECNMKEGKSILGIRSSAALLLRKDNSLSQFQLLTSQPLIIYLHYFHTSLSSHWCSAFRALRVGALLCFTSLWVQCLCFSSSCDLLFCEYLVSLRAM